MKIKTDLKVTDGREAGVEVRLRMTLEGDPRSTGYDAPREPVLGAVDHVFGEARKVVRATLAPTTGVRKGEA